MIYFDTDVLIHMLVIQDLGKHQVARSYYEQAIETQDFFISLLCIQETAYVLQRLGQKANDIEDAVKGFLQFEPVPYMSRDMQRGVVLARSMGFKNINDCIHLAVAETHCSQICTFNKADFGKMSKYTTLEITIL
ncbi:type II toxin-antitoxin system VapC family toxin [Dyadobacter sp. CY343]|uniref:type II toxin-antitoxin system VapC family toxin n=1 Tax=Dyadobacter sp. CY343 TaxID=2907299 RepID=UPI001F1DD584|nr:type II toxin-antitoxin system VapC family toxin [Dyadobacter sp. CY343]MCE7060679.1 type II toxin-antitoxin system VapC family toxin [Dyadobacter sp. CY343]